jgi:ribosomal protein L11 methyltransferase
MVRQRIQRALQQLSNQQFEYYISTSNQSLPAQAFFMSDYLQVAIPVANDEEREILIAELLAIGFESFEEEAVLLKAFIQEDDFKEDMLKEILNRPVLDYQVEKLAEKNWNEEWENNFKPVVIDNFCMVRASFHQPAKNVQHEIVITPKMSFGTGHHATTYMMMEFMKDVDFEGANVLDFGTGTGILAILAEQLGAEHVLAIDLDDWSIENARENFLLNKCANIELVKADNIPGNKSFQIILANINRNTILESLPAMCKILVAKGEILLSGLLEADFGQIEAEASRFGLHLQKKGEKSGWIALRFLLQS